MLFHKQSAAKKRKLRYSVEITKYNYLLDAKKSFLNVILDKW